MTTASNRHASRLIRSLSTASLLLGLAACGSSADTSTSEASSPELPDPSAPVERAVEVVTSGEGEVTVVFESGLGSDWTPWETIATEVAAHARTFAYSRPGYGQSEPTPAPRSAEQIVDDLRTLLASRGEAPPYLLVGHSFGGGYMEYFAKAYPEDVIGVVLVDPRHRDFTVACEQAGHTGCGIPDAALATLPQVQIDEYEAYAHIAVEIADAGPFGSHPVQVLTATKHGFTPEVEDLWVTMLASLADESPDGEQSVFVGAGHYLQLERTDEVAQRIINLIVGD